MRRVHPTTLTRVRHRYALLTPRPTTLRPISSTLPARLPRSNPLYNRNRSTTPTSPEDDESHHIVEEEIMEDPEDSDDVDPTLERFVTQLISPLDTAEPLADDLIPLRDHLLTSLLSANQSLQLSPPTPNKPPVQGLPFQLLPTREPISPEPALAVVSPFEGGRHYVLDAITRVASDIDAEILRFDLALGLGLHGPASPLGRSGTSRVEIKTDLRLFGSSAVFVVESLASRLASKPLTLLAPFQ